MQAGDDAHLVERPGIARMTLSSHKTVSAGMQVRDRVKLSTVPVGDLADRLQPVIHEIVPARSLQ